MLEIWNRLWSWQEFIPHGHCYLWKSQLVGLHLLSDLIIGFSYYSIPILLIYFVHQRQDLPFNWIFFLFSGFIVACGTTHFMDVWTLWYPLYWLSGLLKALTALISLYTVLAMAAVIPTALKIPTTAQLELINQQLQHQIRERQQAQAAL